MTGPQNPNQPGDPQGWQPYPGQPGLGQPAPGQYPPVTPPPGQQFGQPAPGQPQQGQPYPGQQYGGQQPQPGQPYQQPFDPNQPPAQWGQPGPQQFGQFDPATGQPLGAPTPKKNTGKLIGIGVGVVALIAVIGVAAWAFTSGSFGKGGDEKQIEALYTGWAADMTNGDMSAALSRTCMAGSMRDALETIDDMKLNLDDMGIDLDEITKDLGLDDLTDSMGQTKIATSVKVNSVDVNGGDATVNMDVTSEGKTTTETSQARKENGAWCIVG